MSDLTARIGTEHALLPYGWECACGEKFYRPIEVAPRRQAHAAHVAQVTEQAALASAARKVTEFATGLARGLNQYPAGESDYIDGTNDTLGDVVEALGKLANLIDRTRL